MELAQVTFKIETELPTLNEYINAERTNKYIASAMKKKYTNICAMYARQIPKDRKSTRLNSSHIPLSRMPSSA